MELIGIHYGVVGDTVDELMNTVSSIILEPLFT